MGFLGPDLTREDLHDVDRAHAAQVRYLDDFERDVMLRTPPEIAAPTGVVVAGPMSAAEFVARAELYGSAPWATAINLHRGKAVRSGRYDEERRVHTRPLSEHHPCQTCLAESRKGWVPAGTLLPLGDSECLGLSCDCTFQYRRRPA